MLVLGFDPGIATVGFGAINCEKGALSLIQYGVITTEAGLPLSERLNCIFEDSSQLIDLFKPDEIAIEELFFNSNLTTGISVAHGRGVLLLACRRSGVPIREYTPLQVKQSVTGYGKATKEQVIYMVTKLLNLPEPPKPDDTADALAVAICALHCMDSPAWRNREV